MTKRLTQILLALALLAAACGNDSGSAGDDSSGADDAATGGGDIDLTAKPVIEVPGGDAPTELVVTDLVEGTGDEIVDGATAEFQYVGVLFDTGEEFDSSWDRGQPFAVAIGAGQVIRGWDEGLLGMKVGGRRQLTIPSDLAYGEVGQGSIPPNAALIFVVDLLSVEIPAALADEPVPEIPETAPTELEITDRTVGTGPELKKGDTASLLLLAAFQSTGEVFESSWRNGGNPVDLPVGQTIEGLDEGLVGMQAGGVRQFVVPPDMAYGAAGSADGVIGPNESLVFVIELISIDPAPYENVDAADEPTPEAPAEPATELGIDDITVGDGATVEVGDTIAVHYVGVSQSTGEVFDSSWTRGQPTEFAIGVGQVIDGWDQGVVGMNVGGRRQLTIPGSLAYGDAGRPPSIAPDDTLVFVVDVVAIVGE